MSQFRSLVPSSLRSARRNRRQLLQAGGASALGLAMASRIPMRAAAQDQEITITVSNRPPETEPEANEVFDAMIARYEEAHPNVTVDATREEWDPLTFPARIAAGTVNDAFNVAFTEPQAIIQRGQSADVTELIQAWPNFDSFNPGALSVGQSAEGRLFGFPSFGYSLGLLINRDHFTEAGLNPDQPPATWQELRDAAIALTGNGRAGFVETSAINQGGWHFVAWMYSAGGQLLEQSPEGAWTATFNNETGISVLQMLKDMRFTDKTMPERQLLNQEDTRQLMATGQVSISVQAPDALTYIRENFDDVDINLFGMGILPQNGGNATLAGGGTWMFSPSATQEILAAAVDFSLYREFDLTSYEQNLQADQARGALIGAPELPIFSGDFQAQRDAVREKYINAPIANYTAYVEGSNDLELTPEPPFETQQLYAAIDVAVQAVLTDEGADPATLLNEAAQLYQTQVLDAVNAG